jgi:putative aldouronate transport system permease protein
MEASSRELMMNYLKNPIRISRVLLYGFVSLIAIASLLPLLLVLSGSLTSETSLMQNGLRLVPREISLYSYSLVFNGSKVILNGYKISIIVTVCGSIAAVMLNALIAYPLSQSKVKYRNGIAFFIYFTILFNGGIVSWYLICVNYLGLHNNIFALIIPYLGNAWYILILRNYFRTIPIEMSESATIDGAGEFAIFMKIYVPLSTPAIATIMLFMSIIYWNDWWLGIMLTEDPELQPLQLQLRAIISNIQFLTSGIPSSQVHGIKLPSEGIKMATTVITIGPIIFIYPFLQRYFIKGLMIGAVKG